MRTPLHAVFFALAVLGPAALCAQQGERGPRRQPPRVELQNFEFREVEFESANLTEGKGRVGLYLPKGFADEANAQKTYPLVVWLHGFGGYYEFMSRGGASTLDDLRGKGDIPELVFAAFQAPGGRRSPSVYVNGDPSGKIEDAIVTDLVGVLERDYRATKDRAGHAIMGISIGGYGALKIALHHPEVFGVVAAHSSAIFTDDPAQLPQQYARQVARAMERGLDAVFGDPIDAGKWAAEMPMGLVRKAEKGAFTNVRIYFDAGTEDRYGFAAPNEALSKLMGERGIEHVFRLVEGGGHAWSSESMLENLRASLKFVAHAVAPAEPGAADKATDKSTGAAAPAKDGEAGK